MDTRDATPAARAEALPGEGSDIALEHTTRFRLGVLEQIYYHGPPGMTLDEVDDCINAAYMELCKAWYRYEGESA